MRVWQWGKWWLGALLGVSGLLGVVGCGGGGGSSSGNTWAPQDPIANPALPTMVGGTVYSLEEGKIDQVEHATVTLDGVPDNANHGMAFPQAPTATTIGGGYRFTGLPQGTYAITATIRSRNNAAITLTGTVTGIRALGAVPSQMNNLLIGVPAEMVTFTGLITNADGTPAMGAVVTADVTAYDAKDVVGDPPGRISVLLSTRTDAVGRYRLTVPNGGLKYFIAARTATSTIAQTAEMNQLTPDANKEIHVDLTLTTATGTVAFPALMPDIVCSTLPAPTMLAMEQAMVTRLAAARALHASSTTLARLQRMAEARRSSRATPGIIENDVYWYLPSDYQMDPRMAGYYVYRSGTSTGTFTKVGSILDPYLTMFFDGDPALPADAPSYYGITCFAANNQVSQPVHVVSTPLPQITVTGPAEGATVSGETAQVSWQAVPGARSYMVLLYTSQPTYNSILPALVWTSNPATPAANLPTSLSIANQAGTFWWAVSAYNTPDPQMATAESFSAYRSVTVTPQP